MSSGRRKEEGEEWYIKLWCWRSARVEGGGWLCDDVKRWSYSQDDANRKWVSMYALNVNERESGL